MKPSLVRSLIWLSLVITGLVVGAVWLGRSGSLPRYQLLVEGGQATYLDSQQRLVLRPETRLSLTLRPDTAVHRRVVVQARISSGGSERLWPVLLEQTAHGVLRLQGTAQELLPECVGACVLTFYLSGHFIPLPLLGSGPPGAMRRLLPMIQVLRTEIVFDRS